MVRLYRSLSFILFITGCALLGNFSAIAQCTFTGFSTSYCIDDGPVTMSGGTNYFGPGVSTNIFSPATAGIGTHQIVTTGPFAGYTVNTTGTFAPIAGTGTLITLADDASSTSRTIGFNFSFFGNTFTNYQIVSNGFIRFGSSGSDATPQTLPNAADPNNLIALAWSNLDPSVAGGSIRVLATVGTAPYRKLVINFNNVALVSDNSKRVTAQLQLHETTNIIEIHSTRIDTDGSSPTTMGIEDATGAVAYTPPGRNNAVWSVTNDFVQFRPVCLDIKSVTVSGVPSDLGVAPASSTICSGSTVDVTITNAQAGVSYQLQDNTTSAPLSALTPGTGSNLVITSNALTANTTIKVYAQNNTTLCDRDLTPKAVITVKQPPTTADAGPPTVEQCNVATFTMAANAPSVGTGAWSLVSGSGSITNASLRTTTITVAAGNTATLRWTISNSPCAASSDDIVLTNYAPVSAAVISSGGSISQCSNGAFTVSANAPAVGAGAWSVQTGTATIINANSLTATVTGVPLGTSAVIKWTVTNGSSCATNQASITLANDRPPTVADAGVASKENCNSDLFGITANAPTTGVGIWSVVTGTASITDIGSDATSATGVPAGTSATLRWTITNGSCPSSTDDIVLTNYAPVSTANAGSNITQCNNSTFIMAATAPTTGTGVWTVTGSATITNPTSRTTTVTGVAAGSSVVMHWTVSNGASCPTSVADITLTNELPPTTADAGPASMNNCNVGTFTMTGNTAAVGVGTWTLQSGTATITSLNSPITTITGVPAGTSATLRWTIANGTCGSTTDDIILTNYAPVSTANAGANITQCSNGTFIMAATAPTTGTGLWTVTGSATITNPTSRTTTITGVALGGSVVMHWTVSNGASCPTSVADITLTNELPPTAADAGPASMNNCNVGTFTMTGNAAAVGTGTWTLQSGTATITSLNSPTTTITGVPAGTSATLRWTITNGTCGSTTDDIVLTNYAPVSMANAGSDITQCSNGTFIMAATAPTTGTGLWTVTGTATITNPTSRTTTVTGVVAGSSVVMHWTVSNGASCPTSVADITLTNELPPTVADAGPAGMNNCNVGTFTMSGNTAAVGTGTWTLQGGIATITSLNSPITTITGVPVGTSATLRWTITNGTCGSTQDDIVLTNLAPVSTANAGANITQCSNGTFIMAATAPTTGTGLWTVTGAATITDPTSRTTTVTGVAAGSSVVMHWTITNGASCPTSVADITLTNELPPTTADAGPASMSNCNVATFTMTGNAAAVGVGTWTLQAGAATITSLNSPTTTITGVPVGTSATLRWTITNGTCGSTQDDIVLTNLAPVSTADAGANITQCNNGTFIMAATAPTTGTGLWTVTGTATITNLTSRTTTVTGVAAGSSVVMHWTITNGASCPTSVADITLTNELPPTVADAGPASMNNCNVATFTMTGNTAAVGVGTWTLQSGTATITSLNSPTTTITGVPAGTSATLRWTITNGTCGSTTDDIVLTNYAPVSTANAGSNIIQCNNSTFIMSATAPTTGTGLWTVTGTATITNPTSRTTTVTGVAAGSSVVMHWTVTNGASCPTSVADITLINELPPTVADAGPASMNNCNVGTFTMSGNAVAIGVGTWTLQSGTATITSLNSPTTMITGVPAGTSATLRWTITNGTCGSTTDDIVLTNYAPVSTANAGSNITQCNNGTFIMSATAPTTGTGLWTVTGTATITNPTSLTTTVTGVAAGGSVIMHWTVTNGASCPTSVADITLTNELPPTVADAGPASMNNCNVGTFTMTGNAAAVGVGTWTLQSGIATITSLNSPTTTITGVPAGTSATLRWTITNGTCGSTQDDIVLTNLAPVSTANAGSNITQCSNGTFLMAATAPTTGTGLWTVTGTATITNPTSPTTTVTGVAAGSSVVMHWTITNGASCATSVADITLTNELPPTTADAGPASINNCNVGTFTMTGNAATVGVGTWTLQAGAATITSLNSPTTTITGVPVGTSATLRWTITNGTCGSTQDDIVLTNLAPVSTANAGSNITQCSNGTFIMAATAPTTGTGLWTVTGTATITNPTSPTTTVTGVAAGGFVVMHWTVTNGASCPTSVADITLTNELPPTVADAGPASMSNCDVDTFTMTGNSAAVGVGTWTLQSGAATITSLNSPTTTITGVPVGTSATLRWTVANGTCGSTQDDIVLTNLAPVSTANAGSNITQCSNGTFIMAATAPTIGTGLWTVTGSATITNPTSPTTTVTGVSAGGSVVMHWTITNGALCPTSVADITLTNELPPTVADAGPASMSNCNVSTFTMTGNAAAVGVGTWTLQSGTATITSLNSPTTTITGVPVGTSATLRWSITNGTCGSTQDDIVLTNLAPVSIANAGSNITQCSDGTFIMAATAPTTGTGLWTVTGTATITNPTSPTTTVTGVAAGGSVVMHWTITNGASCPTSVADITLTNELPPTVADAGPVGMSNCNVGTFTMTGNTAAVGVGTWTLQSGAATITSLNSPTTTITGVPVGTSATLRWTITNGTCGSTQDDVVLTNLAPVSTADAGSNITQCSNGTFIMAATAPTIGTGLWTVTGAATITNPTSPTTTVTGVAAGGSVVMHWTITNGASCPTSVADITLTNELPPTVADAGPASMNNCNVGTFTMTGNAATVGTGTWTLQSGTATITSLNSPITTITGVPAGTNATLRWTITNGTCGSTTDDIVLTNLAPVSTANAGSNITQCNNSTFSLAATPPTIGTGLWTVTGSATITNPTSPTTTVTGVAAGGSVVMHWTITNGASCPTSVADITLTNELPPTVADAGPASMSNCNVSTFTMTGNTAAVGTGTWTLQSGTATITSLNLPITTITGVPVGTSATLRWSITNGTCGSTTDDIVLTNLAPVSTANAGSNITQCNNGTFLMAATAPTTGTGLWTVTGSATITNPTSPTTTVTGVAAGSSVVMHWTITNGASCPTSVADITLTNDALATVADAGVDQSICGGSTSLAANTPGLGTGVWSVMTGTGGSFTLATNPSTGFTGTPGTTYTLHWTITNGTCANFDEVQIVLKRIPDVSAAPQPYTICSGTSTSIQLNNPNSVPGTSFTWTVLSSPNVTGAAAGSGDKISQMLTTTDGINTGTVRYQVTPSAGGCAGTPIAVDVTVSPVPVVTNTPTSMIKDICSGANVNFVPAASVSGTTFSWTSSVIGTLTNVSASGNGNITDAPVNATAASAVVIYTITPRAGGCDGAKVNVVVTVRPVPTAAAGDQAICSGQSTSIGITDPNVTGTTFSWTISSPANVSGYSAGSGNTISQVLTNTSVSATGSLIYQITPSANGCSGPVQNVTVTVKPVPVITNTASTLAQQICSGQTLAFTATSGISGATFTWTSSTTGPISAASVSSSGSTPGITDTPVNTGSMPGTVVYHITPHHNGCDGTPVDFIVTVKPLPSATIGNTIICSGESISLSIQDTPKSVPGTTFSWTATPSANVTGAVAGNGSTISQTLKTTNASMGNVVYTITPSANGCSGPVTTVTVSVNPSVTVNAGADLAVCEAPSMPMAIPLNGAIGGSATSGTWFIKVGSGSLSSSSSSGAAVTATYTAVPADVTLGYVDLYLVTNDPDAGGPCSVKSDTIRVHLNQRPTVAPLTDVVLCEPARIDLAGMIGGSATSGAWSVLTGGGTLSVSSNTIIGPGNIRVNATYDTIRADVGHVLTLRLTTNDTDGAGGPCVPSHREMNITIHESAKVNAGPDFEVCQDDVVNLHGSYSGTTTSATWTGASNAFNDTSNPATFYTLTSSDINAVPAPGASTITLRLTTNDPDGTGPSGPCLAAHDDVVVKINKLPSVDFFNLLPSYAENSPAADLAGVPAGGTFTGHGIVAGGMRFEPANAGIGVVPIRYTYIDPLTGCDNFAEQTTVVNPVTNVEFFIQQPSTIDATGRFEICENSGVGGMLGLIGNPDAATGRNPTKFESTDPVLAAKIVQAGSSFKINTVGLPGGVYPIRYIYTNSVDATDTLTKFIVVYSAPKAVISIDKACVVDLVTFTEASFIKNNTSGADWKEWDWSFGDGTSNVDKSNPNPTHKYGVYGTYNISLKVTTDQGCSHDTTGTIRVGRLPKVNFNQTKICSGDVTKFRDTSEPFISQIVAYSWNFDDLDTLGLGSKDKVISGTSTHAGRTSGTYKNPNHKYQNFQQYNVTLRVRTDDGCEKDTTKRIYILDYNAPQATLGYMEDFENGPGTWVKGDVNTANSWLFTTPFGDVINAAASGNNAWWTGGNSNVADRATYYKNEKSEVIGPCLDISGLKRPMIALNYWSDQEPGFDGTVVQYSRDGGLTWETIGNAEGNGIDWYNSRDVSGRPGNQNNYAWSSESKEWRNARYNLDQIPINDRDTVVFKIAFGSNGDNPADRIRNGFAFDDVYIGEKNRTVMVEHFTNAQDGPAISANQVLDQLYAAQVATDLTGPGKLESDFFKIEYHLDVPEGVDVLNIENPGDPRARAFYYGISEVPRTVMDGITGDYYGTVFDGDYSRITAAQTDKRALEDPMFSIDIDSVSTGNNHRMKFNLTFHYLNAKRKYDQPVVFQAALIETGIDLDGVTFRNVVRKLLVNGNQGQTVSQFTWDYNDPSASSMTIPIDYELDVPVRHSDNLYLAVFAHERGQDARTILQSRLMKISRKIGPEPVGIHDDPAFAEISALRVYPNPASQVLNLELDAKLSRDYTWNMVDQRGITVLSGKVNHDLTVPQELPVGELANGIYILQIQTDDRKIYFRKVAVMNRN